MLFANGLCSPKLSSSQGQQRSRMLGTLDACLGKDTLSTVSRHGTSGASSEDNICALTGQYRKSVSRYWWTIRALK